MHHLRYFSFKIQVSERRWSGRSVGSGWCRSDVRCPGSCGRCRKAPRCPESCAGQNKGEVTGAAVTNEATQDHRTQRPGVYVVFISDWETLLPFQTTKAELPTPTIITSTYINEAWRDTCFIPQHWVENGEISTGKLHTWWSHRCAPAGSERTCFRVPLGCLQNLVCDQQTGKLLYIYLYVVVDQNSFIPERPFFANKNFTSAKLSRTPCLSFAGPMLANNTS